MTIAFENKIAIFFQLVTVLISIVLIFYFLVNGKRTGLLYSFLCTKTLIFIWAVGQTFELMSLNTNFKWMVVRVEYFSICFIGISWLIFSFTYIEHKIILKHKIILSFFILPLVMYFFVLTNKYHHLFYSTFKLDNREYGIFYWINILLQYTYLSVGTLQIIRYSLRQKGDEKKQSFLLVFAVLIPFISNALYISRIIAPGFDVTTVSFTISLLLFAIATFKYRFLNIVPMALRKIVDNMKEAIIVIDSRNNIADYNNSAYQIFNYLENINIFAVNLRKICEKTESADSIINAMEFGTNKFISGELNLSIKPKNSYLVNVQPLFDKKYKKVIGRIISFNDITLQKKLLEEVNEKNEELSAMNEEILAMNDQLKEHLEIVEELTIEKERNRIALEIHDGVGHTLTIIMALLNTMKLTAQNEKHKSFEDKINEIIKHSKDGFREIKRAVAGLKPGNLESYNLIQALDTLFESYKSFGLKIDLTVQGSNSYIKPKYSNAIYRLCQEALTNAIRHGSATECSIILKFCVDKISLYIFDNGNGCRKIIKGTGLKGMEERTKEFGGKIKFGSDGESGFNIHVELPIITE